MKCQNRMSQHFWNISFSQHSSTETIFQMWSEGNFQLLPCRLTSHHIYFMTYYLPTILASTGLAFLWRKLTKSFLPVLRCSFTSRRNLLLVRAARTETQHVVKHNALGQRCSCLFKMSTLERDCVAISPECIIFGLTKKYYKHFFLFSCGENASITFHLND